MYVDHSVTNTK